MGVRRQRFDINFNVLEHFLNILMKGQCPNYYEEATTTEQTTTTEWTMTSTTTTTTSTTTLSTTSTESNYKQPGSEYASFG